MHLFTRAATRTKIDQLHYAALRVLKQHTWNQGKATKKRGGQYTVLHPWEPKTWEEEQQGKDLLFRLQVAMDNVDGFLSQKVKRPKQLIGKLSNQ